MSKKQVKLNELSYGKIRNVAQLLTNDDSIDLHWKELAAMYDRYQPRHISAFQAAKNPAEALLQDLCYRNVPVDDVYSKLRRMGHKQAMSVLADDVSPQLLEESSQLQAPVPESNSTGVQLNNVAVGRVDTKYGPLPPAPPLQSSELQRCEADLSSSQMNYEWACRETSNFAKNVIGQGAFGRTFRIVPPGGGPFVSLKWILHEVNLGIVPLLCACDHPNLVRVCGFIRHSRTNRTFLVSQFVEGKSLAELLRQLPRAESSPTSWTHWMCRVKVAVGVARGLNYLHEVKPHPLYHGSLKSTNVILDHALCPKLTDYGLAQRTFTLEQAQSIGGSSTTAMLGTRAYTSPEAERSGQVSTANDVYSYGILLLELLTGHLGYDELEEGLNKSLYSRYEALIDAEDTDQDAIVQIMCKKAKWPPEVGCAVFDFAKLCILTKAKDRPPMNQMIDQIEDLLAEGEESEAA